MGYFKQLQIKTMLEKEFLNDTYNCRFCGGEDAFFTKHINWGPRQGNVYHYKRHCKICGKAYHVKRNAYVYDRVKDEKWIKSNSYIKQEQVKLI